MVPPLVVPPPVSRFGAAGSVGTSYFGLFLLPGGLPRRFGSGASGAA